MFGTFLAKGFREYLKVAKQILERNWMGQYTKPSPDLYPHQWNWDSGFIAMGYSHYNQKRAQQEILSLFNYQWPNGMVPQIVFNPKALGNYFPEPDFWQVPDGKLTSGITMPPLHAIACRNIYEEAKNKEQGFLFLRDIFPGLMDFHRYLYKYRDPDQTGLVYIRHPWESGIDNSPAWDLSLSSIEVDKRTLPSYERKDLKHGIPVEQRPSDEDYDRYVYLVDLFRRLRYEEEAIYKECPFLIQDILFNSILGRANHDLMEIAEIIKVDIAEIREWVDQTSRAISGDLWCSPCNKFESYDIFNGRSIHTATAAGFMPLFAGAASREQAELLYQTINSIAFCALHQGNCFTIPNYDMTRDDYDPKNYWRGPVWININWMLSQGLKAYGYKEKADSMNRDMIQLPIRFGFHEYFDSQSGKGYGSPSFSWTAALFIHLVYEYYSEDKHKLDWLKPGKSKKIKQRKILNHGLERKTNPSENIAADLMASISELKTRFYDLNRGLVDYEQLKSSNEYLGYQEKVVQLKDFDLRSLSTQEQIKAFWINLYNTIVVQGIVELNIQSSVKEIPGFFKNIAYQIGEYTFTAEEIEHAILRANSRPPFGLFPLFREADPRKPFTLKELDPRIHFALVCGSRSCAPIRFYDAELIDKQLDTAARNFINSSEVIIVPEKYMIFLSQIFDWYEKDFGGRRNLLQFLLNYLVKDDKFDFLKKNSEKIKIEYLYYDWNLNH